MKDQSFNLTLSNTSEQTSQLARINKRNVISIEKPGLNVDWIVLSFRKRPCYLITFCSNRVMAMV